jgi:sugar phosphate isomerase/epimerase
MDGETFVFPLLGEGKVPWAAFFAALDDIDYAGHLTIEFESWDYYRQVLGATRWRPPGSPSNWSAAWSPDLGSSSQAVRPAT